MKSFTFGRSKVSDSGPCYVIAEVGHNHQGSVDTCKKLFDAAAQFGSNCVKLQKRDNRSLYTKAYYDRSYDNENSYGATYGEHREALEFGRDEYIELKKYAEQLGVEFMSTAFDMKSVEFLEDVGVTAYKTASGDITNTPMLAEIAKLGKPMFVSTGAASMEELRLAHDTIRKHNDKLCLLHCTAGYPTPDEDLNLELIKVLIQEFPDTAIGYSGHDAGILAGVLAYMMGASVVEKHFTLNRAWKGTDHKFSLEPEGLRRQVRDLRRVDIMRGDAKKHVRAFEKSAREKMGKGTYAGRELPAGHVLAVADFIYKSPGNETPPYLAQKLVGKRLKAAHREEQAILVEDVE